jgi:hypothetical protein
MNARLRGIMLGLSIVLGAVGLVGWNSTRFLTAKPVIRSKNLDFLPAPETARVLAFGHTNTLAKLRWIDSFAYFEYQLDRKDDRVAGGGGGFKRLYETLIDLDPQFEPFYEHAALNLSGVLSQHGNALAFLLRGTHEIPSSTSLWRNTVVTLKTFFHLDVRLPAQFDSFLAAWEQSEKDPAAKRMVWDWKRQFGFGTFTGLDQLPYWLTQLQTSTPGSPSGDYIEGTIRDLLARYGTRELESLLATWRIARGGIPATRAELVQNLSVMDFMKPVVVDGPYPSDLSRLLDPKLIRHRYPKGLPPYGPIGQDPDGHLMLKTDPYGIPWQRNANKVISRGQLRARLDAQIGPLNTQLLEIAQRHGSWPKTLEEAKTLGLSLPNVPDGGHLRLDDRQIVVDWPVEPGVPWMLRSGAK